MENDQIQNVLKLLDKKQFEKATNIINKLIQDNPANKLTSDLIGATITITNPHQLVDTEKLLKPVLRKIASQSCNCKTCNHIKQIKEKIDD